jgi:glycosyltransferase involved in cell wall biosynthesis
LPAEILGAGVVGGGGEDRVTALATKSLKRLRRRTVVTRTGFPADRVVPTSELVCQTSGGEIVEKRAHGASLTYLGVGRPFEGSPHQFMAAIWLSARGLALTVVAAAEAETRNWETPLASLPLQPLPSGGLPPPIAAFLQLIKIRFSRRGPQTFYIQGSPNTLAALIALVFMPRRRILYHSQDFLEPGRHRFWEFFERRFARRAGAVILNEENRARFMQSYYRLRSPVVVLPTLLPKAWPVSAHDPELRGRLTAELRHHDRPLRLIFAGGPFSEERCGGHFLMALKRLASNYAVVFTNDSRGRTAAAVAAAGLADRAIVMGALPYQEMLRHMSACDVGLLLYPNDGIGNFYQCPGRFSEYLRCGLPVVASNFPSFELPIIKYDLGRTCDPTSPSAIVQALREVCEVSDGEQIARRQRLRLTAEQNLVYDLHAPKLEAAVRAAMASG